MAAVSHKGLRLLIGLALLPVIGLCGDVSAQGPDPGYLERRLYKAMKEVVTLEGGRPISHCRNAGPPRTGDDAWQRCEERLHLFARHIAVSSRRHQVSPWTLFAIAVTETGLDPFARGRAGERGILQLNPASAGSGVRFVRSADHRRACRDDVDACQAEVIDAAAAYLAELNRICPSEEMALGAYNTGYCRENDYVWRVVAIRDRWEHAYGHATPGHEPGPMAGDPSP